MSEACLFCRMVKGDIEPDTVWEDEEFLAFRDLYPVAPTHILIIPKRHIRSLNDLTAEDAPWMGRLFLAAKKIAHLEGVDEAGYRTVFNCNAMGGQTIWHLHLHLIAGREMQWPPG
jgi:histidine triad (HIT) family protein